MNSANDPTSLMLWLYHNPSGGIYKFDDGSFIWKRNTKTNSLFLCENYAIFSLEKS